jgi:hypothetical protein
MHGLYAEVCALDSALPFCHTQIYGRWNQFSFAASRQALESVVPTTQLPIDRVAVTNDFVELASKEVKTWLPAKVCKT